MVILEELDYELYKCINSEFINTQVIMTDKQIDHVKEKHPDSFDYVIKCLKDTLETPDYILKDLTSNTGLVIKEFTEDEKIIQVVLRLHMNEDEPSYNNSVLSVWGISKKRLESYLRNKIILYKRDEG